MKDITNIDMNACRIKSIGEDALNTLLTNNTKYLDIRNNQLKNLPSQITAASDMTQLWISGNPYECNCDMIWMRDWLVEATNVMDKENIKCVTGTLKGIYRRTGTSPDTDF